MYTPLSPEELAIFAAEHDGDERVTRLLHERRQLLDIAQRRAERCSELLEEARGLRAARGVPRSLRSQVTEFHRMIDSPVLDVPTVPPEGRARLRARLIAEEAFEVLEAILPRAGWAWLRAATMDRIGRGEVDIDLAHLAKELADLDYVVEGTRLECGIPGEAVAAAVHESNMQKAAGPVDEHGKKCKPPGWRPPDIAGVLWGHATRGLGDR